MKSTQKVRVAIAQINSIVGDIAANMAKIKKFVAQAQNYKADIICFPELALCGYPPEDLLLKDVFIKKNIFFLKELVKSVADIVVIVGFVDKKAGKLYNAAAVICNKKIYGIYHKVLLPNYGVFDEKRYFEAGKEYPVFNIGNVVFGINICEDIWDKQGPLYYQALRGAQLIININASPYHMAKANLRENILTGQAKKNKVFIVYNNLIGAQDELVFDGQSLAVDDKGKILLRANAFREELRFVDLDIPIAKLRRNALAVKKFIVLDKPAISQAETKSLKLTEEVYEALVLGLKDYTAKNSFKKVVVGLSGGIDSSLVAVLAVDALGKDNVAGVYMPSRYSSGLSQKCAYKLAENLGIEIKELAIDGILASYLSGLSGIFKGCPLDITEENLQARIRGNILMAFSNKFGWLVLTTGNKSEVSCGYCTLYGDMAGGFSVIKDVPKTLVYKLAVFRNKIKEVIPQEAITRPPSAELRPNQKDSDSLPEYGLLDEILRLYVEEDKAADEIVRGGYDKDVVAKVISLVDKSEYKRRQSAPGIKITPKAFGRDRRMPITNGFNGR